MIFWEKLGLSALYTLQPEMAHHLALRALNAGLVPQAPPVTTPRLQTRLAGLNLPNPLGLAAGFDKNATSIAPLLQTGFGFIEVGAATPLPQPGNEKPRLFRLDEDKAAINRFGFNNDGADQICRRLAKRPHKGVVGLNLGANKTTEDKSKDFAKVLRVCGDHIDFATINISSPNTEKLRDLQGKAALSAVLDAVLDANQNLAKPRPIFLKIAPDLNESELADIADIAMAKNLSAIIATNTTLSRNGLTNRYKIEEGGLSGQPLFDPSTRILAQLNKLTDGQIPLIGVGGISTADQAYAKILAGASALQLYTALVFGGFSIVPRILTELDKRLQKDGFDNVSQAVGRNRDRFL